MAGCTDASGIMLGLKRIQCRGLMIGRNCGRFASNVIASDWLILDASLKSSFGCQRPVCMAAIINPHDNVVRLDISNIYAILIVGMSYPGGLLNPIPVNRLVHAFP